MSATPSPTSDTSAPPAGTPLPEAPEPMAPEASTPAPGDEALRADAPEATTGVDAAVATSAPEAPVTAVTEPPLTGAEAEAALEQLDASLAQVAETLAEEEPAAGTPSDAPPNDPSGVATPIEESPAPVVAGAPIAPSADPVVTPTAGATSPAAERPEFGEADVAEFETAADVVADVASSDVAVPEELVQAASAAAGSGNAQAAPPASPAGSVDPPRKPADRVPDRADAKDGVQKKESAEKSHAGAAKKLKATLASIAPRVGLALLGGIALPLRLMGDRARTMVGMFAGATLATAGIVWGMVLFAPPPKATSPVERLLAIAEKEREAAHADGGAGHGAPAGGHGEAKPKADSHGAAPAKKDAGHGGGGGHDAKPKKKEASHAPAKKAEKGVKKKDAGHGGGGGH